MIQIDFHYEGRIISFYCEENEKMKNIYEAFNTKTSIDIKKYYFLYNGKIIDGELKINQILNSIDKKRNKAEILVCPLNIIDEKKK